MIVPGIMGSELYDTEADRLLWGIGPAIRNSARLRSSDRLRAMSVTDAEREGGGGRVVATRLLAMPDWLPGLGGFEPYGHMVRSISKVVADRAAVLEFAYDWRLSVEHNGGLLARAAAKHLKDWRRHPKLLRLQELRGDTPEPRLVFVAHSMGGLVVRAMGRELPVSDIRSVITLGTPFEGSVKTLQLLSTGAGAPLRSPATATRDACRSMPGVYDLLPWYRCVIRRDDVVAVQPADVVAAGGRSKLVDDAFRRRARHRDSTLTCHVAVAGIGQKTAQSVELDGAKVRAREFGFRRRPDGELIRENGRALTENHGGDGTVFRHSARTATTPSVAVAQQHQALASRGAGLDLVCHSLTEVEDVGVVLGDDEDLGLDVADEVTPSRPFEIGILGDLHPSSVTCTIEDTENDDEIIAGPVVQGRPSDGVLTIRTVLDRSGLFRVRIAAGSSEVTKLVMCAPEQEHDG